MKFKVAKCDLEDIKYPPHVFTEHGAIMLANVLNSRAAIQASVYVVRAFVMPPGRAPQKIGFVRAGGRDPKEKKQ